MNRTIKKLILLFSISFVLHAQNLLPPVGEAWEVGRNVEAVSTYEITNVEGKAAFHINMTSQAGYTLYRHKITLAPGDYTFRVRASGTTRRGVHCEVYSFDEQGKPTMLMMLRSAAGAIEDTLLQQSFTVPANSKTVRIGMGISAGGECFCSEPELLKGKLPLPSEADEQDAEPIRTQWLANWIFLKNDPGEPRVDLSREIMLDTEPDYAFVQMTADNGYDFLVNGKNVGSDTDWRTVELYDITKYLHIGKNRLEVRVMNYDGVGGLLLQGQVTTASRKKIDILTDEQWSIVLPHGGKAELELNGKVPCSPWGNVEFHKMQPPKVYRLELVDSIAEVVAGDVLKFVFVPNQAILNKKELKLRFRFTDEAGRETPLSGLEPFVRLVPQKKRLFVEAFVSRFAMPGHYRAEIFGNGFVVPCGEVTVKPSQIPAGMGQPLPKPGLGNVIENGFYSQSLFIYSTSTPSEEHFRSWSQTGGHLYELGIKSGEWLNGNIFDTTNVERHLLSILEHDPLANVVLKVRIDVPGWWVDQHQDQIFRSNKNRYAQQSFCSVQWREDAMQAVCNTVDYLAARPAGRAIVGVLLMAFKGGEFQLWGEAEGEYDCSPMAQKAFADYQKGRGIGQPVQLPHPALGFPQGEITEEGARVCDLFYRFVAERHAENMAYFVNAFKGHYGERYAIGLYFGYGMEYAGHMSRMLLAGHLGLEKYLDNAKPDLISCPFSYGYRGAKRSHAYMYPVETARLHGALPIGENDIRNCFCPSLGDSSGSTILSLAESVADNRRIRAFGAMHGSLIRYLALDPNVDWYCNPAMVSAIRQDDAFARPLQANPIGGDNQVVLVVNLLEWTRGWRLPAKTFGLFGGQSRDILMRTGRPVSFVTMTDYLANIKKWKQAVIPIPGLLTEEQRVALEEAFGKLPAIRLEDGALLLVNGTWSVLDANASALELWKTFATDEALDAGYDAIWYVGPNFKFKWDGKRLASVP